ncbi:hypothetical protein N7447_009360 [Penicillium robsamsonii]|uniref:uncharacterized protein n=1 Tax=Penicillium robsamsonii TaxID=1792511 RepID=UPI002549488B|nr:uncharacterized protein N7447_009360 [Penicillium robsamsonii]KAJ5817127.1 hypothetical protein N7447_009360 [Penicillium robsamsonii]
MDPAAQHFLESVNWASLHHAYGEATDVPDNLRALLSPNKSDRSDAYEALYSNIFHQATRYQATAYSAPYLLKILENPATPARASVINYLVDLALGIPSTFLPQGVDIVAWRQQAEKIYVPGYEAEYYAEQDELVSEARNENQRKMREYVHHVGLERQRRDAKYELAAYDAVYAGVPLFQKLLEEEDVEVRAFAAYALAWFPGEGAGGRNRSSAGALQRVLDREDEDIMVLASAIIALGQLNGCWKDAGVVSEGMDDLISRLREYGASTRPSLLRFAAAVSLIRLLHHRPEDVSVLAYVLADRSFIPKSDAQKSNDLGFPFHEGDLFQYSGKVLITLNLGDYPGVMSTLLDAFPRSGRVEAFELAEVVLELAFGPRPEDEDGRPVESLNEIQRRAVTALAELAMKYWRGAVLGDILEEWNIPGGSRDECRKYIGLPVGGMGEGSDGEPDEESK